MNFDDLTVNFAHLDRDNLLADWEWLIGDNKKPVLLSAGGDAFVQDTNDGTVHFLDVTEGSLSMIAKNSDEFHSLLRDKDFVTKYFSVRMVDDLLASGVQLGKGQIYSFKIPLVLGGACEAANVELTQITVHFSIAGQIHQQCRGLPDGTPIHNVEFISEPRPKKWWQLWL